MRHGGGHAPVAVFGHLRQQGQLEGVPRLVRLRLRVQGLKGVPVPGMDVVPPAEEQTRHWEKIKKQEGKFSVLDGVPRTAPALLRAYRVQQKAATVGFDWKSPEPVIGKVREELDELEAEMGTGRPDRVHEEFGDFLFSMVNLSRFLRLHPEECLSAAVDKFTERFRRMEAVFREKGIPLEGRTLEEMDAVWNEVKQS